MELPPHGPEPCASANSAISAFKKNRILCGFSFGGEGWIRTTEVVDNRFTVCSLWPLGNFSKKVELVMGLEPATC